MKNLKVYELVSVLLTGILLVGYIMDKNFFDMLWDWFENVF
jgi:hypothetical protein